MLHHSFSACTALLALEINAQWDYRITGGISIFYSCSPKRLHLNWIYMARTVHVSPKKGQISSQLAQIRRLFWKESFLGCSGMGGRWIRAVSGTLLLKEWRWTLSVWQPSPAFIYFCVNPQQREGKVGGIVLRWRTVFSFTHFLPQPAELGWHFSEMHMTSALIAEDVTVIKAIMVN